jgi:penicillin-binding protein 1A
MRAAIAKKPNETFPQGDAPKKELDVPLTPPPDSPVVKEVPKAVEETEPEPAEPDAGVGAGPKAEPTPATTTPPPQ